MTKTAGKKKRKSSKEKIKSMLRELVCDIYRHQIISNINAQDYMKTIEEI